MRALGAADLLRLWEAEQGTRPVERAMVLLAAAAGENEREGLAALTVGARDARLLELRARTFGAVMQAHTQCPQCRGPLELSVPIADLLAPRAGAAQGGDGWHALEAAGWRVRFRLPRALDLAELERGERGPGLRRALLERCVGEVTHEGSPAALAELPEAIVPALAARMEELDPCADILLALTCAGCGNAWRAPFDIVAYFWAELGAHARRLLREVDALARTYGWREADILALGSRRRRAYLELAGA